jgi:HD-GYP domain-containing protein (c-di-GMP phosphodiesterase class II)
MAILDILHALAVEVDNRDTCTRAHSTKVSEHSIRIAQALGHSKEAIEQIRTAARLHDLGKIGLAVSDRLVTEGDVEWQRIRAHPYIGVVLVRNVEGLAACIPAIQWHHERYDGTGYPDRLSGEDIPLDARILAVADAYDAMTSPRLYRPAYSHEEVVGYIEKASGSHFDPRVADAFLGAMASQRLATSA